MILSFVPSSVFIHQTGGLCLPTDFYMCRFRMRCSLFLRIVDALIAANPFFKQKPNAAGLKGFHPIHKCTVAIKMLAYGGSADALDNTLRIGESTVLESLKQFVWTVNNVFGGKFLRPPSEQELNHILNINKARGFP